MIDIQNVSLWRGNAFLLKNVSWKVNAGEHWAILGLNGSGKTTLLNMINGYLFPSSGEVTVLGQRFGDYDLRELRKSIGWVSSALQERFYMAESAVDIVVSGKSAMIGLLTEPSEEDAAEANKLLDQLGCGSYAKRAYQTLSQGEKQKVLIARALMAKPQLLVLDEPCTGLDLFAREQLLTFIEALGRKPDAPVLLYVTHRTEEILPIFSHTILLKKGHVYEAGKTEAILSEKVLSSFFDEPVQVRKHQKRIWVTLADHRHQAED
ncbi:ABC transporter ATP-binding protein [Anoxynatronum buryatiense]|uniref:Iron complex transport system ATP-binding protein n=1 Tax=Anoxynatronum buryatiense TaxID=489973 RepID=A0AA45WU10_9CLOT|nr:ABC transporter ATP-binding protein [Anoxynatronum buryatiense]SMP44618.1 iron complex transport system ATP-binding protein [Anoxynatronum buryatiense]